MNERKLRSGSFRLAPRRVVRCGRSRALRVVWIDILSVERTNLNHAFHHLILDSWMRKDNLEFIPLWKYMHDHVMLLPARSKCGIPCSEWHGENVNNYPNHNIEGTRLVSGRFRAYYRRWQAGWRRAQKSGDWKLLYMLHLNYILHQDRYIRIPFEIKSIELSYVLFISIGTSNRHQWLVTEWLSDWLLFLVNLYMGLIPRFYPSHPIPWHVTKITSATFFVQKVYILNLKFGPCVTKISILRFLGRQRYFANMFIFNGKWLRNKCVRIT